MRPFIAARALVGLVLLVACSSRIPPPVRPAGTAEGAAVVEHRYDRNALVASAVAGQYVVALTEAGSVLRFDRTTMSLDGEHWPARRAVALSSADEQGALLVGFSSGHLARLDPARMALTPAGQVPGWPCFIVRDPGSDRVVAIFGKPIAGPYGWGRRDLHGYRARALDGAWETPIEEVSTVLVDRRRRLWLGSHHGEFGGGIELLDLSSAKLARIPWVGSGVHGFTERADGELWAFGGTSHMGLSDGVVARVQPGEEPWKYYGRRLFLGPREDGPARAPVGKEPVGPIRHIVGTGPGDRLLVVSEGEVFESDGRLKAWKHFAPPTPDAPDWWRDAVGGYPHIRSIIPSDGKLLLTTARDGLATLDPRTGELQSHRLAGQLSIQPESLVVTRATTVVSGGGGQLLLQAGGSSPAIATFPPAPARERKDGFKSRWNMGWGPPRYLPLAGGDVLVIAKWGPRPPGGMVVMRLEEEPEALAIGVLRNGELTQISAESTTIDTHDVFTMGEQIWACRGGLHLLVRDRWQRRADAGSLESVIAVPWRRSNSALLLHSIEYGGRALTQMTVDGERVRVEPLELRLDGRRVGVSDALALDDDRVLLATGSALAIYEVATGAVSALPVTGLDGEAHRLARDRAGRIWIAGRGLWLLDGSRAIAVETAIPAVIDTDVQALVASDDRLYLALGERGLLVVEAAALAAAALAGRLPPADPADAPQRHEGRPSDHAVFVDLRSPVASQEQQSWHQRFDAARDELWAVLGRTDVRAVLAEDGMPHHWVTLYTDDSAQVVSVVEAVLRREGLWEHAEIRRRLGPQGATEELVKRLPSENKNQTPSR